MKNMLTRTGFSGIVILATFVALSVLPGCRNPLDWRAAPDGPDEVGAISLTVNGLGQGRTIMPSLPGGEISFYLEFRSLDQGGDDFSRSWNGESLIELSVGEWRLRVTSYIPHDDGRRKMASSEWVDVTVAPGHIAEYDIMLVPIVDGRGSFAWEISFPANVLAARMRVTRIDGGSPPFDESLVLVGYGATERSALDLPVGLYRVIFNLSGPDGASAEIGKIMHVHQNLESRFADEDGLFANFIFPRDLLRTILGAWNGSQWDFNLGQGRQISAGHFALLPVNGVTNENFDGMAYWFNRISTVANVPTDREGLTELVDAALLSLAAADATFVRADNLWTQASARTAIEGRVANLSLDAGDFYWTGDYTVTVTIGAYDIDIIFVPVPVTGVVIHGLKNRLLEETHSMDLSATVLPTDARRQEIAWQIPDAAHQSIVSLSPEHGGTTSVTGDAAGVATVYAVSLADPSRVDSVEITVFPLGAGVPIEGIEILNGDMTIEVYGFDVLDLRITPWNTTQPDFVFDSSDTDVATVDWFGTELRVTGVSIGTAVITVTSTANPGLSDTITVTVVATPTGVTVSPSVAEVPRNRTRQFTHAVQGPTGVSQAVTWSVDPTTAGTVAGGLFTPDPWVGIGDTLFVRATAADHPGVSDMATVRIIAPEPDTVVITNGTAINIERGTPLELSAIVGPEGAPQEVTWSIVHPSPPGAAISSGNLLLTEWPLYHGSTFTVRAQATGHPNAFAYMDVTITVTPTAVSITSPESPASIVQGGEALRFSATVAPQGASQAVEWEVHPRPDGVSIDANGALTVDQAAALSVWTLTVTARVPGTDIVSVPGVTVNVTIQPTAVVITSPVPPGGQGPIPLYRDAIHAFHAVVEPSDASQDVEWHVLSGSGSFVGNLLTIPPGAGPGSTLTVRARALGSNPPVYTTATVLVSTPEPWGVLVTPPSTNVWRGQGRQFTAQVFAEPPSPGLPEQHVTWSVSPQPHGVSISQSGMLNIEDDAAVSPGQVLEITATAIGTNLSDTAFANLTSLSPTGVTVSPNPVTIVRGESRQFHATIEGPPGIYERVVWTVAPTVAGVTISPTGLLTVPAGTTGSAFTVRASAYGHQDVFGTANVNVQEPGGFTISLPDFPPAGGGILTDIPGPTVSLLGQPQTIRVTNPGAFDPGSIRWLFDGKQIESGPSEGSHVSGASGEILTLGPRIHGDLLDTGTHFLTVEVTVGGELRSRRISFTVEL